MPNLASAIVIDVGDELRSDPLYKVLNASWC
jgi:hypothetical protein